MANDEQNAESPANISPDPGASRFPEDAMTSQEAQTSTPAPLRTRLGRLTIDTQEVGSIETTEEGSGSRPNIEVVQHALDQLVEGPVPCGSPISLTDSRRRARGLSLRPQIFFHNTQNNDEAQAENPTHHAHSEDMAIELAEAADRVGTESKTREDTPIAKGDGAIRDKKLKSAAIDTLPNYMQLTQKQGHSLGCRAKDLFHIIRRKILRINEIPPSKNGRHIPLVHVSQKEQLIDERTGRHYVNNTIRSSRYTLWTFLPRQLIAQFSKLANFYFLCVSILQMIPTLSTTGTYTTIVPLIFFITLSMSKEGYDDYRRYKLDKIENNREVVILKLKEDASGANESELEPWITKKWRDVRVGDIVKLNRDDWVPADILLLASEGPNGVAYIETAALDGESNLKAKQSLPMIAEACSTHEKLLNCDAEIVVEDPNLDLYNFEGKVAMDDEERPLTNSQIIYRGSTIRNTPSCLGLVIFTGEETKIRMNANKNPRTKAPTLQALVNKIVICVVIFVIALSIFNTVAYRLWKNTTEKRSWYLEDSTVPFFPIFAGFIIMFNTLIPLSLYVSLEIVKVAQIVFLNDDIDMYHEETNTPLEARTSTINEDLGQISFIFSDKTGTLTDNSMMFRKLTVAGTAWIHDVDIRAADIGDRPFIKSKKRKEKSRKGSNSGKRPSNLDILATPREPPKALGDTRSRISRERSEAGLQRSSSQWRSPALPSRPQAQLSTLELLRYLQDHPHTFFARKARFFLLSVALCHTCLPEKDDDDEIIYQAASPDENALVRAARELGYMVVDRNVNAIYIKTFPNGREGGSATERYEILDVIEFSSARKRMSIIVRLPNGKICMFCKGADTTIMQLLRLAVMAKRQAVEIERKVSLRRSVEAQEVIRRNSTHRPSIGGPSRNSVTLNRLQPIRDDFDRCLWSREGGDYSSNEATPDQTPRLTPRPSGQYPQSVVPAAARHSIAFGETPRAPMERDTSDDLVDESLALDEEKVFARCFGHINDFASEGLRTLLYGYRFIEEKEYTVWKKLFSEATTSLVNRQEMVERAAEMIERDFELGGGTAIEDKLQKGVAETIDKLRRAGIKLWMLTGDKRETAINIGYSCRLIKDYSIITILDKNDNDVEKRMAAAILEINSETIAHSVVVVDGATLADIEADETLKTLFFDLAILTDSVICCRASPSQKASLVKAIRKKVDKSVTLAIGDGANDIAMIQEAHVGIGITGKEGLQAARVSDYSIAQFRFLLKLLLVHGRWNYVRTCKYVLGTFWKELLFYLTQALYQRYNGYTGTSLYEQWSLSMFNTLFTSLPVIFMGVFEKDLSASTLLAVPELYHIGQRGEAFNFKIYFGWMFLASSQSVITYFMMDTLYADNPTVKDGGVFAMGVLTYSVVVTLISSKLQLIEMHNKSVLALFSFILSVGGWFGWNLILSALYNDNIIYNVEGGLLARFGRDLSWWAVYCCTIAACLIFDITIITIRATFWPTDVDTFKEIEKVPELRAGMEAAASMELQNGRLKKEDESEKAGRRKSDYSYTPIVGAGKISEGSGSEDGRAVKEGRRVGRGSGRNAGGAVMTVGQGRINAEPRSSLHSPSTERPSMSLADMEG